MSTEPQRRISLRRWLDAIALALSFLVFAAWLAQVAYILSRTKSSDSLIFRKIVLFDALPPGILGGGMLVAAAVALRRQRAGGAWLFAFGGIVAFSLTVALTSGVSRLITSNGIAIRGEAFLDFVSATDIFLGAMILSAIVIGVVRWRAEKARAKPQSSLPQSTAAAPAGSRPVQRLPDLLSLLVVLFIWFCVVPMPPSQSQSVPLFVPGPSMFVAGFPVGLVGVIALLAAGLLRSSRDRNRLVALELFGLLALAVIFIAAAISCAANVAAIGLAAGVNGTWIKGLMLSLWALFASAIAAKLAYISAGFCRRRERVQFSLLGLLDFVVCCGALAMYWRVWRS